MPGLNDIIRWTWGWLSSGGADPPTVPGQEFSIEDAHQYALDDDRHQYAVGGQHHYALPVEDL